MNILFFDILSIIILAITPTTTSTIYAIKVFLFVLLIITNIFLFIGNTTLKSNISTTPVSLAK